MIEDDWARFDAFAAELEWSLCEARRAYAIGLVQRSNEYLDQITKRIAQRNVE